jgi:hypothetical protein
VFASFACSFVFRESSKLTDVTTVGVGVD